MPKVNIYPIFSIARYRKNASTVYTLVLQVDYFSALLSIICFSAFVSKILRFATE